MALPRLRCRPIAEPDTPALVKLLSRCFDEEVAAGEAVAKTMARDTGLPAYVYYNTGNAARAGASGYVLKTAADEQLVQAVRAVAAGERQLRRQGTPPPPREELPAEDSVTPACSVAS